MTDIFKDQTTNDSQACNFEEAIEEMRAWGEKLSAEFAKEDEERREKELEEIRQRSTSPNPFQNDNSNITESWSDETTQAKLCGGFLVSGDEYHNALFSYLVGAGNQESHSLAHPLINNTWNQVFYGLTASLCFTHNSSMPYGFHLQGRIITWVYNALSNLTTINDIYGVPAFEYHAGILLASVMTLLKKADMELSDNVKKCSQKHVQNIADNEGYIWHSPADDTVFLIRDFLPYIERSINKVGYAEEKNKMIAKAVENTKPFLKRLKLVAGVPERIALANSIETYLITGEYNQVYLLIDEYIAKLVASKLEEIPPQTKPEVPSPKKSRWVFPEGTVYVKVSDIEKYRDLKAVYVPKNGNTPSQELSFQYGKYHDAAKHLLYVVTTNGYFTKQDIEYALGNAGSDSLSDDNQHKTISTLEEVICSADRSAQKSNKVFRPKDKKYSSDTCSFLLRSEETSAIPDDKLTLKEHGLTRKKS